MYRIYCELGLNLKTKPKKRRVNRQATSLSYPILANACWSMDFMSDRLSNGGRFRTFNVIDDYNRELLLIKPSVSLPATAVTASLDRLADLRGYPNRIRVDNGPEFTSQVFQSWAARHDIKIDYIQPGKPAQNALIERLNRTYREDILDAYLFDSLEEVIEITATWQYRYNHERPHDGLGGRSPIGFAQARQKQRQCDPVS